MSQSACVFSKILYVFSDRKPCVCQQLWGGHGVGKCQTPTQRKITNAPPLELARWTNAPPRGGGGGRVQMELTNA